MPRGRSKLRLVAVSLLAAVGTPAAAVELGVSEGTDLSLAATPGASRLIIDLYGRLWQLPADGGLATPLTGAEMQLRRPDVSADGERIVAEGGPGGEQRLWLLDGADAPRPLTPEGGRDAAPRWHPGGDRIVFTSDRAGSWDLHEIWLADGTIRRLSSDPGSELDPYVSADGSLLAWVGSSPGRWELWLRESGLPARLLHASSHRLSAPSIRPDNGVVLVVEDTPAGARHLAVILSEPPVAKTLTEGEDYFRRPAVWLDRQRYLYAADGRIRERRFGEPRRRQIPFTAWISPLGPPGTEFGLDTDGPLLHHGRYVIRPGRVLDVENARYRHDLDLLIEDDLIRAVTTRRDWPGVPVLHYPEAVALPGLIQLGLDTGTEDADGARLLACGVTTVIRFPRAGTDAEYASPGWNAGRVPGPQIISGAARGGGMLDVRDVIDLGQRIDRIREGRRRGATVVSDALYPDLEAGASLLATDARLPRSPAGRQYEDVTLLLAASGATLLAGGDAVAPPGSSEGGGAEAAAALDRRADWPAVAAPSCRLRQQLDRLQRGGKTPAEAVRRATSETARLLGLSPARGAIAEGARADLLLVAGDPLADLPAAAAVEAVIAGGRLFTPAGLLGAPRPRPSENLTKTGDSEEMSPIGDRFDIRLPAGPWRY